MSRDTIAALVEALGDLTQVVRDADPADKAEIYTQLGLTLTYRLWKRPVEATVRQASTKCKGFVSEGDLNQLHISRSPAPGDTPRPIRSCGHGPVPSGS